MREFLEYTEYIKVIILKVDDFESVILDERNFGKEDNLAIRHFKHRYSGRDDCTIVTIPM